MAGLTAEIYQPEIEVIKGPNSPADQDSVMKLQKLESFGGNKKNHSVFDQLQQNSEAIKRQTEINEKQQEEINKMKTALQGKLEFNINEQIPDLAEQLASRGTINTAPERQGKRVIFGNENKDLSGKLETGNVAYA